MIGAGMKHALYLESLIGKTYGPGMPAPVILETGTPVAVTAPGAVTGIDFALVRGGVIIHWNRDERADRRAGGRHEVDRER